MEWENKFWSLGDNQLAKELLGVDKFHKAGYRGKRVNMGNMENGRYDHPIYHNKVKDPSGLGYMNDKNWNSHGDKTLIIQHMVAPESTICMIPTNSNQGRDIFREFSYNLIKDKGISIVTKSGSVPHSNREDLFDDLFNNCNFKLTVCAHNGSWNSSRITAPKQAFTVSGSHLDSRKREFYRPNYGTKGRPYRAMNSYVPIETPSISESSKTGVHYLTGTSFSTPFFAGMLALVDDFFIDKVGRPLNYKEMTKFILDNAVPTDIVYDEQNYIFVLPDPKNIKVSDYIQDEVKQPDKPIKEVIDMFKDLKKDRYSTEHIEALAKLEIVTGHKDGTFRPQEPVTREQVATMLNKLRLYLERR